ncbi:MAG TPA: rhomboid family intramembrane serine protease [Kofleriaceae bacterium]|nr:rhomboid family intramembrane serine protease [Kofleriaceae bacterium]
MTYELLLISVIVGAGYWGWFFLRQQPGGTMTFGLMQLAAAALGGLGLLGREVDAPWLGVAGAIGVGAGACLLVVSPLVRVVARRLVAADRPGAAARLFDLAELLAPGSGVAEEKALLRAMTEIREGRIEQTVEALTAARERAPGEARLAIDERIAMLYLTAYRWSEAIAHAEAHLFGAPPPREADGSLRLALGIAPPVWVELLGAYGRVGDLDQAARMLARLEDVCAGRDDAGLWIHRARVMFLALAGRTEAVRALLERRRARHMTRAARTYWLAVAHEHHGDRAEAVLAYESARARSRGRPRELIEMALARLAVAPDAAPPRGPGLAAVTREVVARVEAAPPPPPIRGARRPRARATWLVTGALVAVSAVISLSIGDTSDIGVMLRAGGMFRDVIASGEWWRLVACVFVHVGILHLALNAAGMLILGRLAEELLGSARTIAVFAVAGVAGAVASYLASPAGISAGASGAVFGLLGAVFVEITWHRSRYRAAWKRGMWGALAVIAVGQLAYGFLDPVIDQWAHGAGLAAGALLGVVVSPGARWSWAGLQLARALALAFAALVVLSGIAVARTPVADSLGGGGTARHVVAGVAITAPSRWIAAGDQLYQPDTLVRIKLARLPRGNPVQQLAMWIVEEGRVTKDELGAELAAAPDRAVALPDGWDGIEREAAPEDAMGYRQRVRVILCGRAFGDTMVVMSIQVPSVVASAAPAFFAALIASTGPA